MAGQWSLIQSRRLTSARSVWAKRARPHWVSLMFSSETSGFVLASPTWSGQWTRFSMPPKRLQPWRLLIKSGTLSRYHFNWPFDLWNDHFLKMIIISMRKINFQNVPSCSCNLTQPGGWLHNPRCQFHPHSTCANFCAKVFAQLFSNYSLTLQFFVKLAQKMRVNVGEIDYRLAGSMDQDKWRC